MNTLITPLKTGKGNNVKVARKVLEHTVKVINRHATPLPVPAEGEPEIAFEYGACTVGERLSLIAVAFKEMLDKRADSRILKIGRANLLDLVNRISECASELAAAAKDEIMALAATLREIVEPKPKAEAEAPAADDKEKGKGKKARKPAPSPAPESPGV